MAFEAYREILEDIEISGIAESFEFGLEPWDLPQPETDAETRFNRAFREARRTYHSLEDQIAGVESAIYDLEEERRARDS